ncbi:MAG: N-acyl homoserine lactonase family protein [Sphingomonas sp.]|jgi:glyoxylase-like metal-dependent hydrolase (beta-lactamase superfamily II)
MSVRLYAMTCGHLTLPFDALVGGESGMVAVPIPSYLIQHPKGWAVFDSGMQVALQTDDQAQRDRELGPLAGICTVDYLAGDEVSGRLRAFGVDPERIDFLISSHLHFDHIGGNALIPNARWVVQKREWEAGCTPECQEHNHYVPSQYDLGHDRIEADGEHDVFGDGSVMCMPSFGHTPGHQSLRIKLDGGEIVLTADACYMRKTLENLRLPPGFVDQPEAMLSTLREFRALRDRGAQLIYGHDPELWAHLNEGPVREVTPGGLAAATAAAWPG